MQNSRIALFLFVLLSALLCCGTRVGAQEMSREVEAGLFRRQKSSTTGAFSIFTGKQNRVPVSAVRQRAEEIARLHLPYVFGGSCPADGGMDCSGCIKHLLTSLGYRDVPRTSFDQYDWVKENSRIKRTKTIDPKDLKPGDLIFWGGTYKSKNKVTHVMLYMGQGNDGKLYMFGARGQKTRGVGGAGVDVHELRPGVHKNLVGFGKIPEL